MGVLSTAIASPRHVRAFVERQRLIDLLDAVDESRVTTVCAPAGYGKTTAALYWSLRASQPAAGWYCGSRCGPGS